MIGARRRFAVIGDPVEHSLSPVMHAAAFEALGVAATYEAMRVPAGREDLLSSVMYDLASTGGGNVTVPHKLSAARLVDERRAAAERTGAVNCFWSDESGRVIGDNTDVGGFLAATRDTDTPDLRDAAVLVVGAGGAARAVAVACAAAGVASLDIFNRTVQRAERLVADLPELRARSVTLDETGSTDYDLVVNATSLGLRPSDPLPLPLSGVSARYALDLVYGVGGTAWTGHARSLGVPASDGLPMLAWQAALSLECWLGATDRLAELAHTMLAEARRFLDR